MLPALPGVRAALGRLLGGKRSLLVQNQWFLAPPAAATCQNQHTPVNIPILMNRHFQMGNQTNLKQQQKDHSAGNPPTCPSPHDARCQPMLCHMSQGGESVWPSSKAHGSQGAWEWTRSFFSSSDLPAKQNGRKKLN